MAAQSGRPGWARLWRGFKHDNASNNIKQHQQKHPRLVRSEFVQIEVGSGSPAAEIEMRQLMEADGVDVFQQFSSEMK
jgi:hypothetical protein